MDSYRSSDVRAGSRLTQLYANTKNSSQVAVPRPSQDVSPEKRSLDRRFCIQKDRLIAWGFDWTDNLHGENIDESVERAGLTEVVESVLENIKSVIEDVDKMNSQPSLTPNLYPAEKVASGSSSVQWTQSDYARYSGLVTDMTAAIDLLCDLSKSRRSAEKAREAGDKSGKKGASSYERPTTPVPAYPADIHAPGKEQTQAPVQPHMENVPKISQSLLVLPQETPPGYGDSRAVLRGASSSPRLFGHLRRGSAQGPAANDPASLIPVMIEYAKFDRLYKDTDMILPLDRLQQFHSILRTWDPSTSNALAKPMAYFEDPEHARYGLIFELPYSTQITQQQDPESVFAGQPTTLSTLLQQVSRLPTGSGTSNAWIPPLEDRFRLSQQLLKGVKFLQEHDFAHRNISSSNVAILSTKVNNFKPGFDVRGPLICSVDLFSDYDVDPSPELLQQNIYRHPDDPRIRGATATLEYEPRFDLYSLSLVLLEIGMWHPLTDMYKDKYSLRDFKTRVEKVWIRRLSGRCGSAFSRCVEELFAAGNKPQASQDKASTLRLLNRIAARLDRCCEIDLVEEASDSERQQDDNDISANELAQTYTQDGFFAEPPGMTSDDRAPKAERTTKPAQRMLFQDLELPQDIITQYQAFEGQVVRITEKILKRTKESCWIDLLYSGENKETARPTICVGCSSTKLVRSALKKHLNYDSNLFDLAVFKDTVRRSKSAPLRRSKAGDSTEVKAQNPGHQQRPICGASIGAWRFGEHSPAASFGGVIVVDDDTYGMTVHHLLEDPEPEEDTNTALNLRQSDALNTSDTAYINLSDDEDDGSDDESTTMDTMSLDYESDDDPEDEFTFGYRGSQAQEIVLTQPALDDVEEGFFPSKEDEDDEHLLSHRLGCVHASSGLRHSAGQDGVKHEIDWLLMKLDTERLQPYNVIAGGKRFCPEEALFSYRPRLVDPVYRQDYPAREDLYPCQVASSAILPGLDVQCFGRTTGLGCGKVAQTMRWVRFHGRQSFSQVWSVAGDFGRGGDSGAWVVDNDQGRVCGHVLAWSSRFGVAYMAPMDVMLEDMAQTLGAMRIVLPGSDEQPRPMSASMYENIGFDISALSLEELQLNKTLWTKHMLHSGNPAHLEREWQNRRAKLGQSTNV